MSKIYKKIEPAISTVLLREGRRWYIHKGIEYFDEHGEMHEKYEYMWRDGSWHDVCGTANFYESEIAAQKSFDKYFNTIKLELESELFEI
jgi:hypothetical protein